MTRKRFNKVLVANRGEIAIRVLRALKELSIPSVAVYSEADLKSPHLEHADETYCLGEPEPLKSYLNIDSVVRAAKKTGCDAVHPGYGFLSENHLFAARCEKENLKFIGPPSSAIRLLGNKVESRRTMAKQGISIIPGTDSGLSVADQAKAAKKIGLPVLVKAAAGGGGKGMRVVRREEDLKDSVESAKREAKSAFGDDSVYIEKYIESPRHVEFQIIADSTGKTIHCFERECSIQRRHQKIIEETPSTALDDGLRRRMGEAAVKVAKAAGYVNAGTVEFLLDEDKNFYFLEVNTRLQVEHPVTEMTLGIDLVREQVAIALGERLSFEQGKLSQRGHAIECRIYAEDPDNNFMPSPGKILFLKEPHGPGVRVDSGIKEGLEIPVHYDPILSKLIVHAPDRDAAIQRMLLALSNYVILGVKTPIPFLKAVLDHEDFRLGNTDTSFIERHFKGFKTHEFYKGLMTDIIISAALYKEVSRRSGSRGLKEKFLGPDPWLTMGDFALLKGK